MAPGFASWKACPYIWLCLFQKLNQMDYYLDTCRRNLRNFVPDNFLRRHSSYNPPVHPVLLNHPQKLLGTEVAPFYQF